MTMIRSAARSHWQQRFEASVCRLADHLTELVVSINFVFHICSKLQHCTKASDQQLAVCFFHFIVFRLNCFLNFQLIKHRYMSLNHLFTHHVCGLCSSSKCICRNINITVHKIRHFTKTNDHIRRNTVLPCLSYGYTKRIHDYIVKMCLENLSAYETSRQLFIVLKDHVFVVFAFCTWKLVIIIIL